MWFCKVNINLAKQLDKALAKIKELEQDIIDIKCKDGIYKEGLYKCDEMYGKKLVKMKRDCDLSIKQMQDKIDFLEERIKSLKQFGVEYDSK